MIRARSRRGDRKEWRSLFFFSSRRRHTRSLCDWSSDVCSSDLWLGCLRLLQMQAIPCKDNELRIRVTTRFGWRRDQKTKCWMKKSCMVSSWNLLMEGEYFGIMSSLFCVNPSVLLVFRRQFRYQTILCSPCYKKWQSIKETTTLALCSSNAIFLLNFVQKYE